MNDTVAHILRATGVQQDEFQADFDQLATVWFDIPESIRSVVLNWNGIPEAIRHRLEALVNREMDQGELQGPDQEN